MWYIKNELSIWKTYPVIHFAMYANISSLESLALNILQNSFPEKIAEGVNVSELDPCLLCNQELFLYEIKNPITILICGHIHSQPR